MNAPPPFSPPANAPKKGGAMKITLIVLGSLFLCCVIPGVIGSIFMGRFVAQNRGMVGCIVNASMLSEALDNYVAGNGGKLPPSKSWKEALKPFLAKGRSELASQPFDLGTGADPFGCSSEKPPTHFVYVSSVGGKVRSSLPPSQVVVFETSADVPAGTGELKIQPESASPKVSMGKGNPRGWYTLTADGDFGTVSSDGKRQSMKGKIRIGQ